MKPCRKRKTISVWKLTKPLSRILSGITPILSRGNRKLQMTFEDQLNALIYFHLEDHDLKKKFNSGPEEDDFVRMYAPEGRIEKSSFFEAINSRIGKTHGGLPIPSESSERYSPQRTGSIGRSGVY